MSWRATVLTLYPEMFPGTLGHSLAEKARERSVWSLEVCDIRSAAVDRHRTVDDAPAGGGPGMVLKADVLARAIDSALGPGDDRPRLLMSARGRPFDQSMAREFASGPGIFVVCGHFEGVDERIIKARNLREVSIGDYVLSGGELAATVVLDAAIRLLPGVMGHALSADEESFESGLLEHPHYTRPRSFENEAIPDVLLSGDHSAIARWRREAAERATKERRPDLWGRHERKKTD